MLYLLIKLIRLEVLFFNTSFYSGTLNLCHLLSTGKGSTLLTKFD